MGLLKNPVLLGNTWGDNSKCVRDILCIVITRGKNQWAACLSAGQERKSKCHEHLLSSLMLCVQHGKWISLAWWQICRCVNSYRSLTFESYSTLWTFSPENVVLPWLKSPILSFTTKPDSMAWMRTWLDAAVNHMTPREGWLSLHTSRLRCWRIQQIWGDTVDLLTHLNRWDEDQMSAKGPIRTSKFTSCSVLCEDDKLLNVCWIDRA